MLFHPIHGGSDERGAFSQLRHAEPDAKAQQVLLRERRNNAAERDIPPPSMIRSGLKRDARCAQHFAKFLAELLKRVPCLLVCVAFIRDCLNFLQIPVVSLYRSWIARVADEFLDDCL